MTKQPDPTQGRPRLTRTQTARRDFAHRDLETARAADLAQLEPARLILLVERLRGRLDDTLNLVDEIATPEPPTPPVATESHPTIGG